MALCKCNLNLRINPKTVPIPVDFQNLKGYDAYHLMSILGRYGKEVKCIPNNTEKYISFSVGGLCFIDSYGFLPKSLDYLAGCASWKELKVTTRLANGEEKLRLLSKKGIYPYEYMDSWERFSEAALPEKEKFYSSLNDEHITDEEYKHARKVWDAFGCKNLGDDHDKYLKTDVALLADVFENFREITLKQYGLDPAQEKAK